MRTIILLLWYSINFVTGFILVEWYTVEYPTRGECVYQENTSDELDILRLYHEGLHNYFISWHRKYSGQLGRLGVILLNCTDRWECAVEYWRIYNGFPAFWLAVFCMAWYKRRFNRTSYIAPREVCNPCPSIILYVVWKELGFTPCFMIWKRIWLTVRRVIVLLNSYFFQRNEQSVKQMVE